MSNLEKELIEENEALRLGLLSLRKDHAQLKLKYDNLVNKVNVTVL
jgi:hypothetical protein